MIAFIVFAGLLVAGALLLILPPLLGVGARRRREAARQSTMALTVLREHLAELDAELASGHIDVPATRRAERNSSAARSRKAKPLPRPPRRPTYAPAAHGRSAWP